MFVLTVEFAVKPDHLSNFRDRMIQQAEDSLRNESECHQFDVCFSSESPKICFLYEKYTDRAAFEHHLRSDHFLSFNAAVGDWLDSKTVRMWNCE